MRQASENSLARLSGVKVENIQEFSKPTVGHTAWKISYSGPCRKIHQWCSRHSCYSGKVSVFLHLRTRWAIPGGRTGKYSATIRRNEPELYTAAWADQKRCWVRRVRAIKRTPNHFCNLQMHMHHVLFKDANTNGQTVGWGHTNQDECPCGQEEEH